MKCNIATSLIYNTTYIVCAWTSKAEDRHYVSVQCKTIDKAQKLPIELLETTDGAAVVNKNGEVNLIGLNPI